MLSSLRRERGQDLIEYALILPILLLLVFGVVEFALALFSYNTISDAAREAARWGVIVDPTTGFRQKADIEAKAYGVTDAAALSRARVTAVATVDTTAKTVRVVMTYQLPIITPFLGLPGITLQAVSVKRIEVE